MIKAVFFDIDGTLLSHKTNSVPASAVRALEELREKGILTFLATGRHLPELKKLRPLDGLHFDGFVTLNGQYCCNEQGVIYHCPIDPRDIATLLNSLKENPHPCILVEKDQMYINFHNDHVARVQAAIHSDMPELGDLNRATWSLWKLMYIWSFSTRMQGWGFSFRKFRRVAMSPLSMGQW